MALFKVFCVYKAQEKEPLQRQESNMGSLCALRLNVFLFAKLSGRNKKCRQGWMDKKKKKKLWRRTLEWHKLLCNFEERELVSKALILTEDL